MQGILPDIEEFRRYEREARENKRESWGQEKNGWCTVMDVKDIFNHLKREKTTIQNLKPPSSPGVYAVFLKNKTKLPLMPLKDIPPNGLIYIGMSGDLSRRELNNHFESEKTGYLDRLIIPLKSKGYAINVSTSMLW